MMRPPSDLLSPTEILTVSLPLNPFQHASPEPLLELMIARVGGRLSGVDVTIESLPGVSIRHQASAFSQNR